MGTYTYSITYVRLRKMHWIHILLVVLPAAVLSYEVKRRECQENAVWVDVGGGFQNCNCVEGFHPDGTFGSTFDPICVADEVTELAKTSKLAASSYYGRPTESILNLVDGCKISETWDWGCCFHTSKHREKSEWIRFKFDKPQFINYVVIYNRVDCCKERLFPFEILVSDEVGQVRKCQGKSFNIGDPEIPSTATNPIRIECGNLRGNSVKLVGKVNEYINICEVEIFGQPAGDKPYVNS